MKQWYNKKQGPAKSSSRFNFQRQVIKLLVLLQVSSEVHYYPSPWQEVSAATGYMVYVSDTNRITRRELDGSNPKVILSANLLVISCIALSGQSVCLVLLLNPYIFLLYFISFNII